MTDAEIEAHATYTDGAIDEVYGIARRALTTGRVALVLASMALLAAGGEIVLLTGWH